MGFYTTFEQLCKEKGVSPAQVRNSLGISQSTMASWKSRGLTPKAETMQKLANYFGVSVDYLLKQSNSLIALKNKPLINLNPNPFALVKQALNRLNYTGQLEAVKRVEELTEIPRYQAQPSASTTSTDTVYFMVPRFFHPMSAGVGVEAGNEQPDDLRLKKAPPRGTSYVAEVSGDSMEPTYHNGDLLFVRAQEMIELGQVGEFYMDGKQWIKELGDGVLLSRNPAYAPIPMREGIRCQGLVLGVCDESYLA